MTRMYEAATAAERPERFTNCTPVAALEMDGAHDDVC